jgi:hypothetical protein
MSSVLHTPRKHIVPTHLNVPDAVLTLWSFSLTARQLLLLLLGVGLGGDLWKHLIMLDQQAIPGQAVRVVVALLPFLLALLLACYQYAGRYLEVWAIVLLRYSTRPKRYVWRTIRTAEAHLYPLVPNGNDARGKEETT